MSLDEIEKSLEYAIEAVVLGVEEEGIVTGQTH